MIIINFTDMKKLLYIAAMALCFLACENKTPFDTQSPDDYPRILRPYETATGHLEYYVENDATPFVESVTVTPSRYTTVNWYVDDQLVHTGFDISMCFPGGTHSLLIEAVTTKNKRTERTGTLVVGEAIPADAIVLFAGSKDLSWDEHNIEFFSAQLTAVLVGAKIYVEFEKWPAGDPRYGGGDVYQLLRVISDWSDANVILPDTNLGAIESPYSFVYDQRAKDLVTSIGKMSFVGWGINISKIAYK